MAVELIPEEADVVCVVVSNPEAEDDVLDWEVKDGSSEDSADEEF